MPDQLTVAPIPPREHPGWREWAALIVTVGLLLGIWQVYEAAAAAQRASTVNRHIGYRNRAAICDFIREFGGVEPSACDDPALRPYRDPHISPGQGERHNTTDLLCQILASLKQPAAQCVGGG